MREGGRAKQAWSTYAPAGSANPLQGLAGNGSRAALGVVTLTSLGRSSQREDLATNPLQGLAGVGSRAAFVMAQLVSGDDAMVNRMLLVSI